MRYKNKYTADELDNKLFDEYYKYEKKSNLGIILLLFLVLFGIGFTSSICLKILSPEKYEIVADFTSSSFVSAKDFISDKLSIIQENIKSKVQTENLSPIPKEITAEELFAANKNQLSEASLDKSTNEIIFLGSNFNLTYYSQNDERWKNFSRGDDNTISKNGCGPTVMAMLATTFTGSEVLPTDVTEWAYKNNYFLNDNGSSHSIITKACEEYGLKCESISDYSKERLFSELSSGKTIVALMNKGIFTNSSGHFIILRGSTLNGKILISDPASFDNTLKEWEPETILQELKMSSGAGGPLWAVYK